ncbi:MAG: hypothetical protein NT150_06140 [Bacteroidetes bacterium]|nr:hypothetical protein [Bacteroidota bacterium]
MTSIQTDKKVINATAATVFTFLANLNNFNQLLPTDKVEKWISSETECSFSIKKMAAIGLKLQDKKEPSLVHLVSTEISPIKFNLKCIITPLSDTTCETYMDFEGDINMFMEMVVKGPLTQFFNYNMHKLQEIYK